MILRYCMKCGMRITPTKNYKEALCENCADNKAESVKEVNKNMRGERA